VLPAQSEAILLGILLSDRNQTWALVLVASAGNVLGSCANWLLGRLLVQAEGRRWFFVRRESIARAEGWYRRHGRWSLLLSWAPVIGDPLTVAAGVLRRAPRAVSGLSGPLVTVAKVARYVAVAALEQIWF
jgi:membrane protein YqaA with SNARE-associated domain